MSTFLVTGGAGFIGGNFLHIMTKKYSNDRYVCIDALTYAGNMETLEPILKLKNFRFVHADICDRDAVYKLFEEEHFDYVINFAAESHVDNSIKNPVFNELILFFFEMSTLLRFLGWYSSVAKLSAP